MVQDIATRQLIVRLKCFQIPQAVSPETHQMSRLQLLVSNTTTKKYEKSSCFL